MIRISCFVRPFLFFFFFKIIRRDMPCANAEVGMLPSSTVGGRAAEKRPGSFSDRADG